MKNAALITGASSGIGLELAKIHASKGNDLILLARSADKLSKLKLELEAKYHVEVLIIEKDLSTTEAPKQVYDEVQKRDIQLAYLINNAGFGDYGFFHETDWEKEGQMIDLNIKSLTHLTKLFLPEMVKRRRGRIMNVASTAAFQPGPLMAVYYATKHYVLAFSEAIANEVKDYGVTVTALCPGPTESGFQEVAAMEESKLVNSIKMPSSEEVATYGYRAMMQGKIVAVHGTANTVMAKSVGLLPRNLVTKMVRKLQERK